MQLITLNSDFQPDQLIENYQSAIFAERYSTNGDFIITANQIPEMMALLPRGSYISCLESTVPMVVEDHKIVKALNEAPVIEITGRSFETVLERRVAVKNSGTTPPILRTQWIVQAEKESDAAYLAMRTILGDFQRYQSGVEVLGLIDPALSSKDAIPQIDLTLPADYEVGTTNDYEIKPDNLYKTVIDLININHHGIKAVRPAPGYGGSQVGIEIYNGADLTADVVFNARFDQFDKATYLLTEQGSMNVAYVYDSLGSDIVLKTTTDPSGLDRRVILVDSTGDATPLTTDTRASRGLIELYKYNALALFDGEISDQVAAGYNVDYFLGDIIRLDGEYTLGANVRVAEFIRSSDSSGTKAYPTFETIFE